MKNFSKEDHAGLFGSVIIHVIIFIFSLFYYLQNEIKKPEYVELSFTEIKYEENPVIKKIEDINIANNEKPKTQNEDKIEKTTISGQPSEANSKPSLKSINVPRVNLPRYSLSIADNQIKLPDSKLESSEKNIQTEKQAQISANKGDPLSLLGEKEKDVSKTSSDKNVRSQNDLSGVGNLSNELSSSSNVGKSVSNYSIQWKDGGTRAKMSGSLPKLENLSKELQIKLKISVLPDGSISQVIPLQKGDYKLENLAIQSVRSWRFEPLKKEFPQVEQSGLITFIYKLE